MKPQHLIQAFSRTNRIFNKKKRYGHIVTLQTPELYASKIDDALRLYTNGGMNDVQAPSWSETSARLTNAVKKLATIAPTIEEVDELHAHGSLEELQAFAKAYQAVDRLIGEVQVYDEFQEDMLKNKFNMSRDDFERLTGRYHNIIERIKELTIPEMSRSSMLMWITNWNPSSASK